MATLILARHGRTTANVSGVLAGRSKGVHLDERGVEQADAAAERLAGLPLAGVVTSPLERCRETARAIVRRQDPAPKVSTERGLLECDYGDWTGRSSRRWPRSRCGGRCRRTRRPRCSRRASR
jgi:broad specificity phosphatase PhoE